MKKVFIFLLGSSKKSSKFAAPTSGMGEHEKLNTESAAGQPLSRTHIKVEAL